MGVLPITNLDIYVDHVGNPTLTNLTDLESAYKRYRECDKHFSKYCSLHGERLLKRVSLPALYLPNSTEESSKAISLHSFVENMGTKFYAPKSPDLELSRTATTSEQQNIKIITQDIASPPKETQLSKKRPNLRGELLMDLLVFSMNCQHPT